MYGDLWISGLANMPAGGDKIEAEAMANEVRSGTIRGSGSRSLMARRIKTSLPVGPGHRVTLLAYG